MDLDTYLKKHESAKIFAAKINAPESDVSDWRHGKRPIPHWRCKKIEEETGGLVDRKTTCPDLWHQYWPELADIDSCCVCSQSKVLPTETA